jgi:hypothetical protein
VSNSRSNVVSSFTIIKGSLIGETNAAFQNWDVQKDKRANLHILKEQNTIGAKSANWLRDVAKVINRRFDTDGRDRVLVELAQQGCDRPVWNPILLWHMTRDEFLLRDFIINCLYQHYSSGTYRLHTDDVARYIESIRNQPGVEWFSDWTETTTDRVASGLLRIASDFDLLTGTVHKEFSSYHLTDESFIYILHAMAEHQPNSPRRIIDSEDWHMFLMDASDVERELLRLHQFRKLHYEVAGSLTQLKLSHQSAADYAKELCP